MSDDIRLRREHVCPNLDIDGEPAYVAKLGLRKRSTRGGYHLLGKAFTCVNRRRSKLLADFVDDVCLSHWHRECQWLLPVRADLAELPFESD